MKTTQFHKFLSNIANLNTLQYRELKEKINQIDSIKHVSNTIETDYSEISCPHCDSKKILRWEKGMICNVTNAKSVIKHSIH